MALNLEDLEVERLAEDVAKALGVTKTEAIRLSLAEKAKLLNLATAEDAYQEFDKCLKELHKNNPELKEIRITKEDYDAIYE